MNANEILAEMQRKRTAMEEMTPRDISCSQKGNSFVGDCPEQTMMNVSGVLRVLEQTVIHEPEMGPARYETHGWYLLLSGLAPLTGAWAALSINPAGAIPCCFSLERGAPFPSRDSVESPHSGDSTRPNSLPSTFGTLLPRIAGRTGSGLPRGIARNGQLDGSRERVAELSESLRSYALLSSSLVLSSPSPGCENAVYRSFRWKYLSWAPLQGRGGSAFLTMRGFPPSRSLT